MKFDLLTIFPDIFDSYLSASILKRAQAKKKIAIAIHNLRDYTIDRHRTVDDKPYGGGVGMVLKPEPIYKCLKKIKAVKGQKKERIIWLSAKGKILKQKDLQRWSKAERLILLCGHYEGVDERVKKFIDEEVSLGQYVLTGGELGALIIVDGVSRLLPGVLGKDESSQEESYSDGQTREYPQYTRPEDFLGYKVPKILLSGNHQKISQWRQKRRS